MFFPFMAENFSIVWFNLLDLDGQSWKKSTPSSVKLGATVSVDEFRQAIVKQCPNTLSSVDSTQLVVYKNEAAFKGNDDPLDEDLSVSELKTSKDNPLIVIVPKHSRIWSQLGETRELVLEQLVAVTKEYLRITFNRSVSINELGQIYERQKARAIAGFYNSSPSQSQQQQFSVEDRQDQLMLSLLTQLIERHPKLVMGTMVELESCYNILSRCLDGK